MKRKGFKKTGIALRKTSSLYDRHKHRAGVSSTKEKKEAQRENSLSQTMSNQTGPVIQ